MRRVSARGAWRVAAGLLLGLVVSAAAVMFDDGSQHPSTTPLVVDVARTTPESTSPPSTGWMPVALPDRWSDRWPDEGGPVWYRIRWHASAAAPTAILLDAYRSAAVAWLNGSVIHADPNLVEPLSQNQYRARMWVVDAPVVRGGENVLLIRVVGLARSWPGLGSVVVGTPAAIAPLYEHSLRWRYNLQFSNIGVCLACGLVCLSFWLARRHETAYGWTALAGFAWAGYEWQMIAYEPWPFSSSLGLAVFKSICIVLAALADIMALARIAQVRHPRLERSLLAVSAATVATLAFGPQRLVLAARIETQSIAGAVCAVAMVVFVVHTLHSGRLRSVAGVITGLTILVLPFLVQDILATSGTVYQRWFILPEIAPAFFVSMSVALAARLAISLQAAERFTGELQARVAEARAQLSEALEREHGRKMLAARDAARDAERRRLAHDLHDGLGATLVGSIAALESGEAPPSTAQMLSMLRDVRDDLRLVIDTNFNVAPEDSFLDAIASVRHRLSTLLDRQGVRSTWELSGLAQFAMSGSQALELVRILQELVNNAVRHGRATQIGITLSAGDETLRLIVADNGCGFDPDAAHAGVGLRGLRVRAQRLGGEMAFRSDPSGTTAVATMRIAASPDARGAPPASP